MPKKTPNREKRWLMDQIRTQLLPALHGQGFESIALSAEDQKESRSTMPFGRLRRERGELVDLAEIVLGRYGEPCFDVSFGVVPATGFCHQVVGFVPADQAWSGHLPRHYSLCQLPFLGLPFKVRHWPNKQVTEEDVAALVTKVTAIALREIEDVLRHNRIGKHVKIWG